MHLHLATNLSAKNARRMLLHPGALAPLCVSRGRQLVLRLLHLRHGGVPVMQGPRAEAAHRVVLGQPPNLRLSLVATKRMELTGVVVKRPSTLHVPPLTRLSIKKPKPCMPSNANYMSAASSLKKRKKRSSVRLKLNVLTAMTAHNAERHLRTYASSCRWKNL